MSGIRSVWTDGQAVTTEDLQRGADVAAVADDLVFEALLPANSASYGAKRVLPLGTDDEGDAPQALVTAGDGFGHLLVEAALYEVTLDDPAGARARRVAFSARVRTYQQLDAPVTANPTGVTRTDTLYAVASRSVTVTATRRVKGVTGEVTSPALPVETTPTVTFLIAAGAAVPADSGSAWNVPLATIAVPAGYVEGAALGAETITQVWQRAFVPASMQRAVLGSAFGTAAAGALEPLSPEPDWSRFGSERKFVTAFKHTGNTSGAVTLGGTAGAGRLRQIDWDSRLVRFSLVRAVSHAGTYPAPHAVTLPGASVSETSPWVYTGRNSAGGTLWTSAGGFVFKIDGGVLKLSAGGVPDSGAGDGYTLIVETMDRFV